MEFFQLTGLCPLLNEHLRGQRGFCSSWSASPLTPLRPAGSTNNRYLTHRCSLGPCPCSTVTIFLLTTGRRHTSTCYGDRLFLIKSRAQLPRPCLCAALVAGCWRSSELRRRRRWKQLRVRRRVKKDFVFQSSATGSELPSPISSPLNARIAIAIRDHESPGATPMARGI